MPKASGRNPQFYSKVCFAENDIFNFSLFLVFWRGAGGKRQERTVWLVAHLGFVFYKFLMGIHTC